MIFQEEKKQTKVLISKSKINNKAKKDKKDKN